MSQLSTTLTIGVLGAEPNHRRNFCSMFAETPKTKNKPKVYQVDRVSHRPNSLIRTPSGHSATLLMEAVDGGKGRVLLVKYKDGSTREFEKTNKTLSKSAAKLEKKVIEKKLPKFLFRIIDFPSPKVDVKEADLFVVLLPFNEETINSRDSEFIENLLKGLGKDRKSFLSKTIFGLCQALSNMPNFGNLDMEEDELAWKECKKRKLLALNAFCTKNTVKLHMKGTDFVILHSQPRGVYSAYLQEEGKRCYRWPSIPGTDDWRELFYTKALHLLPSSHRTLFVRYISTIPNPTSPEILNNVVKALEKQLPPNEVKEFYAIAKKLPPKAKQVQKKTTPKKHVKKAQLSVKTPSNAKKAPVKPKAIMKARSPKVPKDPTPANRAMKLKAPAKPSMKPVPAKTTKKVPAKQPTKAPVAKKVRAKPAMKPPAKSTKKVPAKQPTKAPVAKKVPAKPAGKVPKKAPVKTVAKELGPSTGTQRKKAPQPVKKPIISAPRKQAARPAPRKAPVKAAPAKKAPVKAPTKAPVKKPAKPAPKKSPAKATKPAPVKKKTAPMKPSAKKPAAKVTTTKKISRW